MLQRQNAAKTKCYKVMRKTKFKVQRTAVIRPMNNNIFNIF